MIWSANIQVKGGLKNNDLTLEVHISKLRFPMKISEQVYVCYVKICFMRGFFIYLFIYYYYYLKAYKHFFFVSYFFCVSLT